MKTLDELNQSGKGKVWFAGRGTALNGKMKREMLSQCYTTKWRDIPWRGWVSSVISEHIFSVSSGLVFTVISRQTLLCSQRELLQSTGNMGDQIVFNENSNNFFQPKKTGNDSNLLIVFYVQIMPMTLSCSSTDFENDSDFRPSRAVLPQIQVMPLNSLRISLADYVQLSLQAGFIQRPAIRHPYHHVKG